MRPPRSFARGRARPASHGTRGRSLGGGRCTALSLIELLVALAVLSIGVLALAMAQVGAIRVSIVSGRLQRAASQVESELADLRSAARDVADDGCHTLSVKDAGAGWACEIRLTCVHADAGGCRAAAVRLKLVAPDGLEHSVYSAVTWPEPTP